MDQTLDELTLTRRLFSDLGRFRALGDGAKDSALRLRYGHLTMTLAFARQVVCVQGSREYRARFFPNRLKVPLREVLDTLDQRWSEHRTRTTREARGTYVYYAVCWAVAQHEATRLAKFTDAFEQGRAYEALLTALHTGLGLR